MLILQIGDDDQLRVHGPDSASPQAATQNLRGNDCIIRVHKVTRGRDSDGRTIGHRVWLSIDADKNQFPISREARP